MNVLIVDDETNIRELMGKFLRLEGIDSFAAGDAFAAQRLLREQPFDACIVDLKMPGMDGLELIKWIRGQGFRMPIIMISAHGEISDAVEALKHGAQDYIVKPFNPDEVIIRIKALVEAQNLRNIQESGERQSSDHVFVGESVQIRRIKDLIGRVAATRSTVLITGESGTGKEVVARSIHAQSQVSGGPFVAVNIGGVPENLLESELFGYEKGAFTGAVSRKSGMFELASGGTLFLDEIGDMPVALQVKILRVLQEHSITRLGGTEPIPINARIVCATNKNLEEAVRNGTFREDLFYRLNVVRIQLPPLRERRDDIPLLAHWILQKINLSMGRRFAGFTAEAMELLKNHSFYGNVRELENIIERAAIFSDGELIAAPDLDFGGGAFSVDPAPYGSYGETASSGSSADYPEVFAGAGNTASGASYGFMKESSDYGLSLKEIEKKAVAQALKRHEGNRTRAAEELGISRRTLITKIQEYGLE